MSKLTRKEKVRIIAELSAKYPFKMLLKIAGISKSVYYYYIVSQQASTYQDFYFLFHIAPLHLLYLILIIYFNY